MHSRSNRSYIAPAAIFLAFVLLFLTCVSVPFAQGIRLFTLVDDRTGGSIRFGLWGYCLPETVHGYPPCTMPEVGWTFDHIPTLTGLEGTISSRLTGSLSIHPIVTALVFFIFILASILAFRFTKFRRKSSIRFVPAVLTAIAAVLATCSFVIDAVVVIQTKVYVSQATGTARNMKAYTGAIAWLSFIAAIILWVNLIALSFLPSKQTGRPTARESMVDRRSSYGSEVSSRRRDFDARSVEGSYSRKRSDYSVRSRHVGTYDDDRNNGYVDERHTAGTYDERSRESVGRSVTPAASDEGDEREEDRSDGGFLAACLPCLRRHKDKDEDEEDEDIELDSMRRSDSGRRTTEYRPGSDDLRRRRSRDSSGERPNRYKSSSNSPVYSTEYIPEGEGDYDAVEDDVSQYSAGSPRGVSDDRHEPQYDDSRDRSGIIGGGDRFAEDDYSRDRESSRGITEDSYMDEPGRERSRKTDYVPDSRDFTRDEFVDDEYPRYEEPEHVSDDRFTYDTGRDAPLESEYDELRGRDTTREGIVEDDARGLSRYPEPELSREPSYYEPETRGVTRDEYMEGGAREFSDSRSSGDYVSNDGFTHAPERDASREPEYYGSANRDEYVDDNGRPFSGPGSSGNYVSDYRSLSEPDRELSREYEDYETPGRDVTRDGFVEDDAGGISEPFSRSYGEFVSDDRLGYEQEQEPPRESRYDDPETRGVTRDGFAEGYSRPLSESRADGDFVSDDRFTNAPEQEPFRKSGSYNPGSRGVTREDVVEDDTRGPSGLRSGEGFVSNDGFERQPEQEQPQEPGFYEPESETRDVTDEVVEDGTREVSQPRTEDNYVSDYRDASEPEQEASRESELYEPEGRDITREEPIEDSARGFSDVDAERRTSEYMPSSDDLRRRSSRRSSAEYIPEDEDHDAVEDDASQYSTGSARGVSDDRHEPQYDDSRDLSGVIAAGDHPEEDDYSRGRESPRGITEDSYMDEPERELSHKTDYVWDSRDVRSDEFVDDEDQRYEEPEYVSNDRVTHDLGRDAPQESEYEELRGRDTTREDVVEDDARGSSGSPEPELSREPSLHEPENRDVTSDGLIEGGAPEFSDPRSSEDVSDQRSLSEPDRDLSREYEDYDPPGRDVTRDGFVEDDAGGISEPLPRSDDEFVSDDRLGYDPEQEPPRELRYDNPETRDVTRDEVAEDYSRPLSETRADDDFVSDDRFTNAPEQEPLRDSQLHEPESRGITREDVVEDDARGTSELRSGDVFVSDDGFEPQEPPQEPESYEPESATRDVTDEFVEDDARELSQSRTEDERSATPAALDEGDGHEKNRSDEGIEPDFMRQSDADRRTSEYRPSSDDLHRRRSRSSSAEYIPEGDEDYDAVENDASHYSAGSPRGVSDDRHEPQYDDSRDLSGVIAAGDHPEEDDYSRGRVSPTGVTEDSYMDELERDRSRKTDYVSDGRGITRDEYTDDEHPRYEEPEHISDDRVTHDPGRDATRESENYVSRSRDTTREDIVEDDARGLSRYTADSEPELSREPSYYEPENRDVTTDELMEGQTREFGDPRSPGDYVSYDRSTHEPELDTSMGPEYHGSANRDEYVEDDGRPFSGPGSSGNYVSDYRSLSEPDRDLSREYEDYETPGRDVTRDGFVEDDAGGISEPLPRSDDEFVSDDRLGYDPEQEPPRESRYDDPETRDVTRDEVAEGYSRPLSESRADGDFLSDDRFTNAPEQEPFRESEFYEPGSKGVTREDVVEDNTRGPSELRSGKGFVSDDGFEHQPEQEPPQEPPQEPRFYEPESETRDVTDEVVEDGTREVSQPRTEDNYVSDYRDASEPEQVVSRESELYEPEGRDITREEPVEDSARGFSDVDAERRTSEYMPSSDDLRRRGSIGIGSSGEQSDRYRSSANYSADYIPEGSVGSARGVSYDRHESQYDDSRDRSAVIGGGDRFEEDGYSRGHESPRGVTDDSYMDEPERQLSRETDYVPDSITRDELVDDEYPRYEEPEHVSDDRFAYDTGRDAPRESEYDGLRGRDTTREDIVEDDARGLSRYPESELSREPSYYEPETRGVTRDEYMEGGAREFSDSRSPGDYVSNNRFTHEPELDTSKEPEYYGSANRDEYVDDNGRPFSGPGSSGNYVSDYRSLSEPDRELSREYEDYESPGRDVTRDGFVEDDAGGISEPFSRSYGEFVSDDRLGYEQEQEPPRESRYDDPETRGVTRDGFAEGYSRPLSESRADGDFVSDDRFTNAPEQEPFREPGFYEPGRRSVTRDARGPSELRSGEGFVSEDNYVSDYRDASEPEQEAFRESELYEPEGRDITREEPVEDSARGFSDVDAERRTSDYMPSSDDLRRRSSIGSSGEQSDRYKSSANYSPDYIPEGAGGSARGISDDRHEPQYEDSRDRSGIIGGGDRFAEDDYSRDRESPRGVTDGSYMDEPERQLSRETDYVPDSRDFTRDEFVDDEYPRYEEPEHVSDDRFTYDTGRDAPRESEYDGLRGRDTTREDIVEDDARGLSRYPESELSREPSYYEPETRGVTRDEYMEGGAREFSDSRSPGDYVSNNRFTHEPELDTSREPEYYGSANRDEYVDDNGRPFSGPGSSGNYVSDYRSLSEPDRELSREYEDYETPGRDVTRDGFVEDDAGGISEPFSRSYGESEFVSDDRLPYEPGQEPSRASRYYDPETRDVTRDGFAEGYSRPLSESRADGDFVSDDRFTNAPEQESFRESGFYEPGRRSVTRDARGSSELRSGGDFVSDDGFEYQPEQAPSQESGFYEPEPEFRDVTDEFGEDGARESSQPWSGDKYGIENRQSPEYYTDRPDGTEATYRESYVPSSADNRRRSFGDISGPVETPGRYYPDDDIDGYSPNQSADLAGPFDQRSSGSDNWRPPEEFNPGEGDARLSSGDGQVTDSIHPIRGSSLGDTVYPYPESSAEDIDPPRLDIIDEELPTESDVVENESGPRQSERGDELPPEEDIPRICEYCGAYIYA